MAPSRAQKSKSQVEQEFGAIRQEREAAQETASPKSVEIERLHAEAVRHSVESVFVESVAQRISALNGEVSRTLLELSEKLTAEVDLLVRVREVVELERQELERPHKIDIAATALDQLVDDYGRDREHLEAEIQTRRTEWEQESRTAERERKEAEEALRKQRQRELERTWTQREAAGRAGRGASAATSAGRRVSAADCGREGRGFGRSDAASYSALRTADSGAAERCRSGAHTSGMSL